MTLILGFILLCFALAVVQAGFWIALGILFVVLAGAITIVIGLYGFVLWLLTGERKVRPL